MYCGDETASFIGDISSYSSCFGYGGEDCPKAVYSSYMYQDGTVPTSLLRRPNSNSHNNSEEDDTLIPIYSPYPKLHNHNTTNNNDFLSSSSSSSLNPNSYLYNDGIICNYNAYENIWMKAFHDLNVTHLGKHFSNKSVGNNGGVGNNSGSGGTNNSGKVRMKRLYPITTSTTAATTAATSTSTNINHVPQNQYDDSIDINTSLIHPIFTIDSGNTSYGSSDNNNNNNSETNEIIKRKQRANILEILFESLSTPSAFIAPSPMVSSFAFGRQTSLIVDIGSRGMTVTPIVDGLCLYNAQRRNGRGGEYLNAVQYHVLTQQLQQQQQQNKSSSSSSSSVFVKPRYMCHHHHNNDDIDNNNNHYNYFQNSIYHDYALRDIMYEMKTSTHITGVSLYRDQFWTIPFLHMTNNNNNNNKKDKNKIDNDKMDMDDDEEEEKDNIVVLDDDDDDNQDDPNEDYDTKSKRIYTLPDGTKINVQNTQTGKDLCRIAELFFADELPFVNNDNVNEANLNQSSPTLSSLPIHQLIKSSLSAVADADVRKELCGNIILTGASSLFPNIEQRLSLEVSYLVPNMYRCKVIASRNTIERRYSPWIGGSVLTSLGSFQQLWLSKKEYEEYGAMLSTQRFP